jgi:diketogulonate reductase-like aldo/keto reductase
MSKTLSIPQTGDLIPIIGFGSGTKWQWKKKGNDKTASTADNIANTDPDLVASVIQALETGFVHLDTAEIYTTRPDIGEAITKYLNNHKDKKRSDIFVTDKYHAKPLNTTNILPDGSIRGPYASLKAGLKLLNLDYVDLFLLHTVETPENLSLSDMWKEMIQLQKDGLAKNIGVSNFDVPNLEILKNETGVLPQVLQIEFHPYLQNQSPGIIKYAKDNNILIEAYGPLIPITKSKEGPLIPLLDELSKKYNASITKILLKFVHSQGFVTVTTSSKIERMKEILQVYDFKLDNEDIEKIKHIGDSWFFRAFPIPPLDSWDEQLKLERNVINN